MGYIGQYIALIGLIIGLCMAIAATFTPNWARNSPEDTVRDDIQQHKGLWIECTRLSTGNWDCEYYQRFFINLPAGLQGARGFCIGSILVGLISAVAFMVGMKCCTCSATHVQRNARRLGGGLGIIAGIFLIVAVSWYAGDVYRIYQESIIFQQRGFTVTRWIFGESLFIGWVGGVISIAAGAVGLCTGCGRSTQEPQNVYGYGGPQSAAPISDAYV